MNKINLAFLSFFSIQVCTAQSAIFDLFESNPVKSKAESTTVVTSSEDLTDQIVDNYTTQNVQKKSKVNSHNQNTISLSPEQIQQKQMANLTFAIQAANKAAAQATSAANNLAAKIQLLAQAQESMQKTSQDNCSVAPYNSESISISSSKAKY